MRLAAALAPIVDFVFPPRCPLCGTPLAQHGGLCAACWSELAVPGAPDCRLCHRPFGGPAPLDAVCAPCLATPPAHDGIVAATLYNEASRRLVLAFKRGRHIGMAPLLGRMIGARLAAASQVEVGPGWLVVPVPLHPRRLWLRGFNQSALLAREIARQCGARVLVDALVRVRATPSLGGLNRAARKRTLQGAIRARAGAATHLKGSRIVLVDDVLTSGATSGACVRALKRAGAEQVVIACFARVLDEAPGVH